MNLTEGNEVAVGQQEEDRTLPLVLRVCEVYNVCISCASFVVYETYHMSNLVSSILFIEQASSAIKNLLPFLTYGQVSQSVLMKTFVEWPSICLPYPFVTTSDKNQ